jgi:hypothetical protein
LAILREDAIEDAGCGPLNPPLEAHLLLLKYSVMHLHIQPVKRELSKYIPLNVCIYIILKAVKQKKENKNDRYSN